MDIKITLFSLLQNDQSKRTRSILESHLENKILRETSSGISAIRFIFLVDVVKGRMKEHDKYVFKNLQWVSQLGAKYHMKRGAMNVKFDLDHEEKTDILEHKFV